jgi:hypothetical protein
MILDMSEVCRHFRIVFAEQAPIAADIAIFLLSHDVPQVDDRRVVNGIIYVIKHG